MTTLLKYQVNSELLIYRVNYHFKYDLVNSFCWYKLTRRISVRGEKKFMGTTRPTPLGITVNKHNYSGGRPNGTEGELADVALWPESTQTHDLLIHPQSSLET